MKSKKRAFNGLQSKRVSSIPVQLTEKQFNQFMLPQLPKKTKGRAYKISRYKIFNYILTFLYIGCQWKMLPISQDKTGKAEIHYSQIFRVFQQWLRTGTLIMIF